ncbi:hypothetical protein B0H12DRAFT_1078309 [Mycena haematopus]|nr:hypothetical protein B0H12DRAFT_1078309 [Mycena haematopus]
MGPPHSLSVDEVASLMDPSNHPERLSAVELENLLSPLTDDQTVELVERLGLSDLARQLPPVMIKVMSVAQRLAQDTPPEEDDDVDRLIRNFDAATFFRSSPLIPPLPTPLPANSPPRTPPRSARNTGPPQSPVSPSPVPRTPVRRAPTTGYIASVPAVNSPGQIDSVHTDDWFEAASFSQGVSSGSVVRASGQNRKGYVIFFGGRVGVYTSWNEVQPLVKGHGLAIHSSFPSVTAAQAALDYARARGLTGDSTQEDRLPAPVPHMDDNPLNSASPKGDCLECSLNTTGINGNLFKSYSTREAAQMAFARAERNGRVRSLPRD